MLALSTARYRCTSCGDCCRNWQIPLDAAEAKLFREQAAQLIPAAQLAKALHKSKHNGVVIEAIAGPGASCPVLQPDNLCAIHGKFGGETKPATCQIFPFMFVATPTETRVSLSYACPAVIDAEGTPLVEQRADIEALYQRVVDGSDNVRHVRDAVELGAGQRLTWAQARQVLSALTTAFAAERGFLRQVGRSCAVSLLLQSQLEDGSGFADALKTAVDGSADLLARALAEPIAVDRLSAALLRTLIKNSAPGQGDRLSAAVTSLFGGGQVFLRSGGKAAWSAADAVAPGIPPEGDALLARWFGDMLEACLFFGDCAFGLGICDGLDLLVLSAAGAVFIARAEAAAAVRSRASLEDVKRGLRQMSIAVGHRGSMPAGLARALEKTATLDLLRQQLGAAAA